MTFSERVSKMIEIIKDSRLALIAKGETVPYDDDIPDVIEQMTGGQDTQQLINMIERPRNTEIVIPEGTTRISDYAFYFFSSLKKISIPAGVTSIGRQAFFNCGSLGELSLPSSLTLIGEGVFYNCYSLVDVYMENGFNCNYLSLSSSTHYSHDTILSWFNALADRTGQTTYTLLIGTGNLNKMAAEEIAIATNKNWNIA